MTEFNHIVVWFGTIVIVISFIIALSVSRMSNSRAYMKYFFIYPLVGILLSVNTILIKRYYLYPKFINFSLQNFLSLIDLTFWFFFFSNVFGRKNALAKLRVLYFTTFCLALLSYIFNPNDKPNLHVVSLINICKTLFCIYYYFDLFKKAPNQKIKSEPSFWIVAGLLFYSCLSVPFYALNDYLRSQFPFTIADNIFSVSNILIIIMHFFFIKAFLCTLQLRKA